jgi:putative membrane protein
MPTWLLLLLAVPTMQDRFGWHWDGHPMWWMWSAGGIVMMLGMLLFWAAIITAIVVGIRWLVRQERSGWRDREDRAMQILRERYARGDISREEFEQRKRDLS